MSENSGAYFGIAFGAVFFSAMALVASGYAPSSEATETVSITYDFIITWGTNSSYQIDHTKWHEELDIQWYDKNGNKMKTIYPYKIAHGDCKTKENCVWQDDESQPAVSFVEGEPIQIELELDRIHSNQFKDQLMTINTTKVVNQNDRISEFYIDNSYRSLYVFETYNIIEHNSKCVSDCREHVTITVRLETVETD